MLYRDKLSSVPGTEFIVFTETLSGASDRRAHLENSYLRTWGPMCGINLGHTSIRMLPGRMEGYGAATIEAPQVRGGQNRQILQSSAEDTLGG